MLVADRIVRPTHPLNWTNVAIVSGAVTLAYEPIRWLWGTWYSAGYDGVGWIAFALVLTLAGWSMASPWRDRHADAGPTYILLLCTAGIRLLAQLLDINVVGALLLAVDVYAMANLVGLPARTRPLSAFWLAALFCFALPVEPIVQRLLGYGLQQLSAGLACSMLAPFFADLVCTGVRLQVDNQDVLVDLPCSGAQLLSTTALVSCLVNTVRRPTWFWGLASLVFSLMVALLGNAVRVSLLAAGIAKESALGFSVMAPLPHELIGLLMVFVTSALIVGFSRYYRINPQARLSSKSMLATFLSRRRAAFAFFFLAFALTIGAIQPQPVDKSPPLPAPEMPRVAAGFLRQTDGLTLMETNYFTRYGGSAARASYGPFGLLLVSTASPLRHLHDPTICLSAMGYSVRLLGTDHKNGATVYRASLDTSKSQPEPGAVEAYTIYVTYLSSSGVQALSVAEVVWLWARRPREHWTMVQRIVPVHATVDTDTAAEFESVMRRWFSIQTHTFRSTL